MHIPGIGTLSKLLSAILLSTLFCLPAATQNDQQDGQQAGLRMTAVVERTVHPPRHRDRDHDHDRDEAVIYNLSPAVEGFSILEERQTMLVDGGRSEQVQLTTVVVK